MKLVTIIFSVFLIVKVTSLPVDENHRWTLVRDGEGKLHMMDMNPIEENVEKTDVRVQDDVFFLLFTQSNPTIGTRLNMNLDGIESGNWNSNNPLRIIIHGWQSNSASSHNILKTAEFMRCKNHNVVVVDWGAIAQTINYITARNQVSSVGVVVAKFIDNLHARGFLTSVSDVKIIGHSLGAHVAGNAGKYVTRGRIRAIYGTDPAGRLFSATDSSDRLSTTDADYTEALHTNAGNLGFDQPITRAAFYPNWGTRQPGCGIDATGACAHERSNLFYVESICGSVAFRARRCSGYSQITAQNCPGTGDFGNMGTDEFKTLQGVFFLETNSASPFARG